MPVESTVEETTRSGMYWGAGSSGQGIFSRWLRFESIDEGKIDP